MKICPHCGEEVRDTDEIFHQCAPSIENGKPIAEQKFKFVDWLVEWWKYCIFTPSFSGSYLSIIAEDTTKWLLYNITTITIPIWFVTLIISKFILEQLGIILGLAFLIYPPILVSSIWGLMLKGKEDFALTLSIIQILISIFFLIVWLTLFFVS